MELRQQQEQLEAVTLSPHACRSAQTRGRARPETECGIRTCFQRDTDRIVYSKAFRRLKHKTQVFLQPLGDHYRTRMTHTLEVSRIARTIARALALNEDLTEAIALGHDLGHTPFGHAGEYILNEICPEGFSHYKQSVRVVEVVEKKGWVTEEEVTDYFAIGQCTPGIIAVNTSVFIGYRQRGVPGGIAAALGVVFPSFVVITIIAAFLTKFATYPVVQHALAGINAAVVALIAVSVLKLGKTNLRGRPAVCIFLGVLVLGELSGLLAVDPATPLGAVLDLLSNPAFLVVAAGATGWLLGRVKLPSQGGEDR